MIDWLIQSMTTHPDLAEGLAPEGLLSLGEQQHLAGFSMAKRRRDWLLGRWTAKHLLQSYVARYTGVWLPLDTFIIESDPDGAPRVIADCRLQIADFSPNLQSTIYNLQLSISHSNGNAFCAISDCGGLAIGADIERIAPRAPEFADDYFTPPELMQVAASPVNKRDAMVTLIWSAKEAALKALRLGLTVDTRRVSIELCQPYGAALAWAPLAVRSTLPQTETSGGIYGWWWVVGEYVLTLALMQCCNKET
jgi:4'-phosphopantetheinyl transferase